MDAERDDAWLIRGLTQGDQEAARVFWERYGEILQRIADKNLAPGLRRRIGPETICQSACMSFLRRAKAGEFQLTDGEGLWRLLCAMTLTKIREKARFHHRKKRDFQREQFLDVHGPDDSRGGGDQVADRGPSPIEALEFEEEFTTLFSDFNEEERQLVELKLQQYTNEEAAVQMGCSERTVRRILNRVKERLENHFNAENS